MARSLCLRWVAHHRFPEFFALQNVHIAWLHIEDVHSLPTLERAYIAHFSPPHNSSVREGAPTDRVTLHLKTNRDTRDRLLGALRARGTTMQGFFEKLMEMLIANPEYIEQIEHWDDTDEDAVKCAMYALS